MESVELRLNEFANLYPEPKQTIRSIIARDEAPFARRVDEGRQRTYGSVEILAWALMLRLRKMGMEIGQAANGIRDNTIADQILDAVHRGDDISNLFLIADCHEKVDAHGRVRAIWGFSLQPLDAVTEILARGAASHGTRNLQGEFRLGLSGATIVPVKPVLQWCQSAVVKAGFVMNGRYLTEQA
jgi:hypothetical protein